MDDFEQNIKESNEGEKQALQKYPDGESVRREFPVEGLIEGFPLQLRPFLIASYALELSREKYVRKHPLSLSPHYSHEDETNCLAIATESQEQQSVDFLKLYPSGTYSDPQTYEPYRSAAPDQTLHSLSCVNDDKHSEDTTSENFGQGHAVE